MEPGIYTNISNEEYHKGGGLSSSGLKLLTKSPAHYRVHRSIETAAMIRGTAAHCAVFEPERFEQEYTVEPEVNKRTKAGQAEIAALALTGKIVLSRKDYADVLGMAEAVKNHSLAYALTTGGVAEQSVYWKQKVEYGVDNETKILCKCRPDYVKSLKDDYVIVDLKTTTDARTGYFPRKAYWDYGYHISAAHYITGMTEAVGTPPREFIFVAVESEPPYGVIVYRASRLFVNSGIEENDRLYKLYASCLRSDEWPCYASVIHDMELPRGA